MNKKMSTIGPSRLEIQTRRWEWCSGDCRKPNLGNDGSGKAMGVEINLLMKPNGTHLESDHEAGWYCEASLCAATRLELYAGAAARSADYFYTRGSLESFFFG